MTDLYTLSLERLLDLPFSFTVADLSSLHFTPSECVAEFTSIDGSSHRLTSDSLLGYSNDQLIDLMLDDHYLGMWPVSQTPWFPLTIVSLIDAFPCKEVCGSLIIPRAP